MATGAEEQLMEWLRDAHAAEEQAKTMLNGMANRIVKDYPKLNSRLQQHLRETERHAELIRICIERREGSISSLKDTGAKILGLGQALSGMFAEDAVMKGCIATYAFEAMEIASYNILISASREIGDDETARVCKEILKEEEAMASWLQQNIPIITRQYIA
jgi:ferritin-like metal-binding protein YciE